MGTPSTCEEYFAEQDSNCKFFDTEKPVVSTVDCFDKLRVPPDHATRRGRGEGLGRPEEKRGEESGVFGRSKHTGHTSVCEETSETLTNEPGQGAGRARCV